MHDLVARGQMDPELTRRFLFDDPRVGPAEACIARPSGDKRATGSELLVRTFCRMPRFIRTPVVSPEHASRLHIYAK